MQQILEAELSPGGVYYADIAEEAVRTADLRFLVRELQCRVVNYHMVQAEIAELKKVFGASGAQPQLQLRLDNNIFTVVGIFISTH